PLGGNNITKDLSIGLRTSTVDAEQIKKTYGHAYYGHASEDETFKATIIGSNHQETYNKLEISDMIDARDEEINKLAQKEIKRMVCFNRWNNEHARCFRTCTRNIYGSCSYSYT